MQTPKEDGWELDRSTADHHQFKHPVKKGTVTVPHPKKEFAHQNNQEHIKANRFRILGATL